MCIMSSDQEPKSRTSYKIIRYIQNKTILKMSSLLQKKDGASMHNIVQFCLEGTELLIKAMI